MRAEEPATEKVSASAVRQKWSQLLNRVSQGEARVIVERSGLPIAAIISVDDLAKLVRFEANRRRRFQALEDSWAAFDDLPADEIEREIERSVREVRGERRREAAKAPAQM